MQADVRHRAACESFGRVFPCFHRDQQSFESRQRRARTGYVDNLARERILIFGGQQGYPREGVAESLHGSAVVRRQRHGYNVGSQLQSRSVCISLTSFGEN